MANVTEMPPTEAAGAETSGAKTLPPTTSASQPEKKKTGRPRKGEEPDPETRTRQFFDRAAQIPAEDWGNRAWMYLYIDEPVCDDKQWGKMRYAKKLHQPIFDLEKVKEWYGSCKGWISLNLRKPDAQNTDQIARHEFEIFDIHCPPKIPKACWTDDPVNKRWAALLPPEPKAQTEGATSLLDSIKVYKEIRDEVRDEREDPELPFDQTRSTLETMKLAKELFAPAATATATAEKPADPFDTASKIMAMRANDPMTAVMMQLLTNANAATEAAREREFKLQQQLLESKSAPAKGLLDQLLELAAMGDKLDPLKKLFGFGNGAEAAGRAARTTGLDVVRDLVTGPAGATLAQGIGVLISNLASATATNPGQPRPVPVLNAQQPNGTIPPVENPEQRIQRIGETVTRPMLGEYFMKNATGSEWAQAMFDLWPEDYVFMRTLGAENIVNRYRRYPEAWAVIGYREKDFIEFITQFCAWDPNAEDGPAPPGNGDDGVVDLENQEAGS